MTRNFQHIPDNKTAGTQRIKGMLLVTAAALFFILLLISLHRDMLPKGVEISGWKPGKMSVEDFSRHFSSKIAVLESTPVELYTNFPGNRNKVKYVSLKELGLQADSAPIFREVDRISQGPVWRRLINRFRMQKQFRLNFSVDRKQLQQTLERIWPGSLLIAPENAARIITADDAVRYKAGSTGFKWDEAALVRTLKAQAGLLFTGGAGFSPEGISIPYRLIPPEITLEDLKSQRVERKVSQFSTPLAGSGGGRLHNIRITAENVNGMLIPPGGVFDFGSVIEQTRQNHDYQEAPVILNGHLVPGIGGGICQVSSTLYNAALLSGLDIVERKNHSRPVGYLPLGRDATFAEGVINFKFRNSTQAYLLVKSELAGGQLTIKLFGSIPETISYSIETKRIGTLPAPLKYVKNPQLETGTQQLIRQGKIGYVVETYRIARKNGSIIRREKLSRDTYKPQATLIAVKDGSIVQEQNTGKKPLIEDGVDGPNW